MDEREMVRSLALARVGVGAGMFALPGLTAATWVGRDAKTAGVRTLSRGFGVRDAVIGVGLFRALENGGSDSTYQAVMQFCGVKTDSNGNVTDNGLVGGNPDYTDPGAGNNHRGGSK